MDRLTISDGTEIRYIGKHTKHPGLECASTMRVAAIREVMRRLCAYENTGLEPSEITGTFTPKPEPKAAKPCMYCAPDALRRGQYVKVKNIIGRWDDYTVLTYCWNCGRKIKEDK